MLGKQQSKASREIYFHRNRGISNSQEAAIYQKLVNCSHCCCLWSCKWAQSRAASSGDQRSNRCLTRPVPFLGLSPARRQEGSGMGSLLGCPKLGVVLSFLMPQYELVSVKQGSTCQILLASHGTCCQSCPFALVVVPLLFTL